MIATPVDQHHPLAMAALAWWWSGDPGRFLSVVIVATPCPLILAAPIALLSGISRAARVGVVVKGAGVIERLGSARTVLLDKTGTITLGTPHLQRLSVLDGLASDDVLRLAASLDQVSLHPLAEAVVRSARERDLALEFPGSVREHHGEGIEGTVGGRRVVVGSRALLDRLGHPVPPPAARGRAFVGVDGVTVAELEFVDPPRHDALDIVPRLHRLGVVHVAMLTGDHASAARTIADAAHIAAASHAPSVSTRRAREKIGGVSTPGGVSGAPGGGSGRGARNGASAGGGALGVAAPRIVRARYTGRRITLWIEYAGTDLIQVLRDNRVVIRGTTRRRVSIRAGKDRMDILRVRALTAGVASAGSRVANRAVRVRNRVRVIG